MPDVRITPLPNGPYLVAGPITLLDSQGRPFIVEGEQVWLCRCGQSAKKPFCDGTHKQIGFQDQASA